MDYRNVIKTALQGYDEQTISLERELAFVKSELKNTVELLAIREDQILNLESALEESTSSALKMEEDRKKEDESRNKEFIIALEKKNDEIAKQSETYSTQFHEIRQSNMLSIQNIMKESTRQISDLENQITEMKTAELNYKKEIERLRKDLHDRDTELNRRRENTSRQEREIARMKKELMEACENRKHTLQKLKQIEVTAQNLNEQRSVLQDENKGIKCEMVERIKSFEVLLEASLDRNRDSQMQMINVMKMMSLVSEDCSSMKSSLRRVSGEAFAESVSIGVQVKLNFDDICFEDTIIALKRKISQLTQNEIQQNQQLQHTIYRMDEIEEENNQLREMVRNVKRMRVDYLKEKQEEEDERRIQRIEDGLVRLRSHMSLQGNHEGLPHLLSDIRGELAELKGKSWYRVVRHSGTADAEAKQVEQVASVRSPICVVQGEKEADRIPTYVPKVEESLARSKQRNRVKFSGIQGFRSMSSGQSNQ